MKGKIEYAEITIYSLIVLLLVALSVTGYQGAQERKAAAAAGYMPSVIGIAVDYWATEPTEVRPPLYGLIASEAPYKAMVRGISPLTYPLPGQSMDCMADIRCIKRKGHEGYDGYIGRVIYTGGKESMIRWLYWPDEATPPVETHDLLLMGATYPAACNGYYDYQGTMEGLPWYKHTSEDYVLVTPGYDSWTIGQGTDPNHMIWPALFNRYPSVEPIGAYTSEAGTGNVTVYPVNVTLSGAITPAACNGTYVEAGELNGYARYVHTSRNYLLYVDIEHWLIKDIVNHVYLFLKDIDGGNPVGAYIENEGSGNVTVSMQ